MDWYIIGVSLHLTATALAMSAVTILHHFVNRAFRNPNYAPPSSKMLHTFSLVIWIGLILMAISGIILFLDRPQEFIASGKFQAKMVIVLILFINGVYLNIAVTPRMLGLDHQDWLERSEKFSRAMSIAIPAGVVSMASWWGALVLGAVGRQPWTFSQILSVYLGIIILGFGLGILMLDRANAKKTAAPARPRSREVLRFMEEGRRSLHILIAEGNVINQKLAARLLEDRGHTAVVASDGRQAIAALENKWFDLLLMDVNVPEIDGFEITTAIRESEKATGNHIPIVAMMADAMNGDRKRCLEAGMNACVSKPLRANELFQVIEDVVATPAETTMGVSLLQPDNDDVIDRAALISARLEDSVGLLKEAIVFVDDFPTLLQQIHVAIANRDSEGLQRAAHSLRESVANFPGEVVYETALKLQMIGRGRDLTYAKVAYAALEAAIERFKPSLAANLIEAGTKSGLSNEHDDNAKHLFETS